MAIRNIKTKEEDVLRKKSKDVTLIDDKIKIIVKDMIDTMINANGVGLAAPQIGILRRIIVFNDGTKIKEIINPIITFSEGEQISKESCLSIVGIQGDVKRPQHIIVAGLNLKGQQTSCNAFGQVAAVISHEIDHLNGILYIDKIINN